MGERTERMREKGRETQKKEKEEKEEKGKKRRKKMIRQRRTIRRKRKRGKREENDFENNHPFTSTPLHPQPSPGRRNKQATHDHEDNGVHGDGRVARGKGFHGLRQAPVFQAPGVGAVLPGDRDVAGE